MIFTTHQFGDTPHARLHTLSRSPERNRHYKIKAPSPARLDVRIQARPIARTRMIHLKWIISAQAVAKLVKLAKLAQAHR